MKDEHQQLLLLHNITDAHIEYPVPQNATCIYPSPQKNKEPLSIAPYTSVLLKINL
jgi:hypothetical protein